MAMSHDDAWYIRCIRHQVIWSTWQACLGVHDDRAGAQGRDADLAVSAAGCQRGLHLRHVAVLQGRRERGHRVRGEPRAEGHLRRNCMFRRRELKVFQSTGLCNNTREKSLD